jgi:anthranilate phosphoribosyltransferase
MPRPAWLLPTPTRKDEEDLKSSLRVLTLRLMRGEDLSHDEAASLLDALLDENATSSQIAAALVALAIKGETVEELAGLASSMRWRAVRLNSQHENFIDTAGTGSSAVKTFNVSTAAAFVIAGAGLPVAKHGSRAATSKSGSADVLTALGVNVNVAPEISEKCLNEIGICFMFAPLYHGATARVVGVRRELGVHTTFNLLGPLTNPAGAPRQIIGVWHEALVEPLAKTLSLLGTKRSWVVHGLDGLDEITLEDKTFVAESNEGKIKTSVIAPEDFGLERGNLESLRGGDAEENAKIIRSVLNGERHDAARSLVIINAASALYVGGIADDLKTAAMIATESIDNGKAEEKLEDLIRATTE